MSSASNDASPVPRIAVADLTMAYGSYVIQRDMTFDVRCGEIFIIMGGSGCGKSTLLRHLIGQNCFPIRPPPAGDDFESIRNSRNDGRGLYPGG